MAGPGGRLLSMAGCGSGRSAGPAGRRRRERDRRGGRGGDRGRGRGRGGGRGGWRGGGGGGGGAAGGAGGVRAPARRGRVAGRRGRAPLIWLVPADRAAWRPGADGYALVLCAGYWDRAVFAAAAAGVAAGGLLGWEAFTEAARRARPRLPAEWCLRPG